VAAWASSFVAKCLCSVVSSQTFYAPAQRLVIEVDGAYHAERVRTDVRRNAALARAGHRVGAKRAARGGGSNCCAASQQPSAVIQSVTEAPR